METVERCPGCGSSRYERVEETGVQMDHTSCEIFTFQKCKVCDLVFLSPRVEAENLGKYYPDSYLPYRGASVWGRFSGLVEADQKKLDAARVGRVREALGGERLGSEDLLLDVGCGKPTFLEMAKQRLGGRALGLDFSDHGWREDAERYRELDLQVGTMNDLEDRLEPRVISMWHYLEHDYAPFETLERLGELSNDRTRLLIEVPNYDSETRRKYQKHWAGYHTPRHISLFSPSSMSALLERTGWTVIRINTYGTLDPYVLDWMSRMERKGINWGASMESKFPAFVLGMLVFRLKQLLFRRKSWGIMSVLACR